MCVCVLGMFTYKFPFRKYNANMCVDYGLYMCVLLKYLMLNTYQYV